MLPISTRLKTMAEYLIEGEVLADIGTDHAYLPIYAVEQQLINKVVAGEVNQGPYMRAKAHVMQHRLSDKIDVRHGNGLDVLEENEVTIITIAGMGGNLIAEILEAGMQKLSSVKRLILQPMGSEPYLRKWLLAHKYQIINEKILQESGIIYEIIVAEPTEKIVSLTEKQLQFGPFLYQDCNEAFVTKWKSELLKKERILKQINTNAVSASIDEKQAQIVSEIEQIKEVLAND